MWFFENSPLFSCLKKWMHGDAAIKNRLVDMGAGGEGTGRRGRRRWEELRVAWPLQYFCLENPMEGGAW